MIIHIDFYFFCFYLYQRINLQKNINYKLYFFFIFVKKNNKLDIKNRGTLLVQNMTYLLNK